MIISLLGYMGSGKSHVSKLLSQKMQYKLHDLDKEISLKLNKNITAIFQNEGEIYFRKKEKEVLELLLAEEENCILSIGGGTPCFYDNMSSICEKSTAFYLRTSVPVLTQRLLKNKQKRPLIARIKDEDLSEYIAKHLFERNAFYEKAHHIISTDHKTPDEIVEEIVLKLHGY